MRAILTTVTMIAALTCVGMASDGVIEINQARALAGGVTPSDTPGFPVTIDSPGSYRLTGNLNVPAGVDGIDVTANDVTIDLGGFAIVDIGRGALGISDPSNLLRRITVVNGVLRSFHYGVYLGGRGNRVERVHVDDSTDNAISVGGDGLVAGCMVENAHNGILVQNGSLVTGNVVGDSVTGLQFIIEPSLGLSSAGYSGNVFRHNTNNVRGGVSLGANLCDMTLCQ